MSSAQPRQDRRSGAPLLRTVVSVCAATFFAVGIGIVALQGRREDARTAGALIPLAYADGFLYLIGSGVCLYALSTRSGRRTSVVSAVILTIGVFIPTTFSISFPLLVPIWLLAARRAPDALG